MAMTGGGGFPASFTISGGPWEGVYDRVVPNTDGSSSYYGPTPSGTVRAQGSWSTFPVPPLHFTVHPGGSIHASLDMSGSDNVIKNAHLHWNGGNPSWDLNALDSAKESWRQAIEATHPNGVYSALQAAANQLATGVTPAFVPTQPAATAASTQSFDLGSDEDFPSLTPTARAAPETATTSPTPAEATPVEAVAADAYAYESDDDPGPPPGFENEPQAWAQEDYQADEGEQEDLSFLNVGPDSTLYPSSNPPVLAYLDEADEITCTFAVSGGGSLSIDRATLEGAVNGTITIPLSQDWVTFEWQGAQVDLPRDWFTDTT